MSQELLLRTTTCCRGIGRTHRLWFLTFMSFRFLSIVAASLDSLGLLKKFHANWWVEKINEKEGSSVVSVADADHWFLLEQPDVVNRRLDVFFAED